MNSTTEAFRRHLLGSQTRNKQVCSLLIGFLSEKCFKISRKARILPTLEGARNMVRDDVHVAFCWLNYNCTHTFEHLFPSDGDHFETLSPFFSGCLKRTNEKTSRQSIRKTKSLSSQTAGDSVAKTEKTVCRGPFFGLFRVHIYDEILRNLNIYGWSGFVSDSMWHIRSLFARKSAKIRNYPSLSETFLEVWRRRFQDSLQTSNHFLSQLWRIRQENWCTEAL